MKYFEKGTILKSFYDSSNNESKKRYFTNYNKTAYQYTNLHVVDDMLSTGFIHASEINFLNDTDEYKIGYQALYQKVQKELKGAGAHKNDYGFFSISFTEKKDDVPQYMIYSGEIGVSIGYDFGFGKWGKYFDCDAHYDIEMRKPMLACRKTEGEAGLINFYIDVPKEVEYCNLKKAEEVVDAVYELYRETSNRNSDQRFEHEELYIIPCFIKNQDFASEKEVRITVVACEDKIDSLKEECFGYRQENVSKTKIEFLKSKNKWLKPYISVFYTDGVSNIGWPIKEIWVGPGKDQNRAFESLKMRLEYGEVNIFPLPLTEYLVRLVSYYNEMTDYINKIYKTDILNFDNFMRSIFTEYQGNGIKEAIEFIRKKLQEFKGVALYYKCPKSKKKVRVVIGVKITQKYYDDNYIAPPSSISNYNQDAFSNAKIMYEKIRSEYICFLKNIQDSETNKILDMIDSRDAKIKIRPEVLDARVQEILEDYENNHFFSSIGIVLHKSNRSLAH